MKEKNNKEKNLKDKSLLSYYGFTKKDQKKYPVVADILRKLTPEEIEREAKEIKKVKLPEELQRWVDKYKEVGGDRNDFIWKWVYNISQIITLSSTEKKYQKSLWEIKFLMIMFVVLIDDIADKYKNKEMLKKLIKIPFDKSSIKSSQLKKTDKKFIGFVINIWKHIKIIYKNYPQYKEFEKIINFDLKQLLNCMEYAYLINNDYDLINEIEYTAYFPHNMQLIIDVMFDLCCSLKFDKNELGKVRQISSYAQLMARIGNWISTWEREINENDFTSAIFAYALNNDIILIKEMNKNNKNRLISKIQNAKVEKKFLKEWEINYQKIRKFNNKIKTIEVSDFSTFLEKVIFAHLISRGYK